MNKYLNEKQFLVKYKKTINRIHFFNANFSINFRSFVIVSLLHYIFSFQNLQSQSYYEFSSPKFSYILPDGWENDQDKSTFLIYDKYVRVKDGRIDGFLRVSRDIYIRKIGTIWNLNSEAEKALLEKEAVLRNYIFVRDTISGRKTVRINCELTLGENEKRKDFKVGVYKFLIKEGDSEYVISFSLITETKNYVDYHKELLSVISTFSTSAVKPLFLGKRDVVFKEIKYTISKPLEYDFFDKSIFKDMRINEFTRTYCFREEMAIYDFELLVPRKLKEMPTIHFYTLDILKDRIVTPEEFAAHKSYWKEMYDQPNYEKVVEHIFSDSIMFCKYEKLETKPIIYTHLK